MSQKQKGSVPLRKRERLKASFSFSKDGNSNSKNIIDSQDVLKECQLGEMAYRPEYIEVWLWYAFNALADNAGLVSKSQLKVLAAHIQTALMSKNEVTNDASKSVNMLLNDRLETNASTMTFEEFITFLKENNFIEFEKLEMSKLEGVCWLLCSIKYEKRISKTKAVTLEVLHNIWKLFNYFTEPGEFPPCIVKEECSTLTEKLLVAMGTRWVQDHFDDTAKELKETLSFGDYLVFLEGKFLTDIDEMCVSEGVKQVVEELVEEIEKMGFLKKKGHNFTTWRDRFFVLKPGSLAYYVSSDLRELKGIVDLKAQWKIDVLPDVKGYRNLFALVCEDPDVPPERARYDMSAPDPMSRQEWVTALKYVIRRTSNQEESENWRALKRRRKARRERKKQEEEAERLKQEDMEARERQKKAYDDLQKAHEEVSKKADEEAALRKAKEQEEEENRLKMMQHQEKTQKEIEELKAAQEEALQRAQKEAELRLAKEREEAERRRVEEQERARLMKEFKELQDALNDAEKRATVEAALKEAEKMRMLELQQSLEQLESLLEEERQAKKDEEIVRTLQARLLEEETEKREELERLQKEQEQLLKQEQDRREHLEQYSEELANQRREQAELLERERNRLAELESERKEAGEKLQEAIDKLLLAEEKKKEEERRKKELEKPIGLARLVQPSPDPLKSSHRGVGAFTISQFETIKKLRKQLIEQKAKLTKSSEETDQTNATPIDQDDSAGKDCTATTENDSTLTNKTDPSMTNQSDSQDSCESNIEEKDEGPSVGQVNGEKSHDDPVDDSIMKTDESEPVYC